MRRRVWIIRAGEDGSRVDELVADAVVALEYPDVGDGRSLDLYDITERLKSRGWTSPETRAELFSHFVNQVRVGDFVVMPDPPRRDVVIGRIDGDYQYAFQLDDLCHRRGVTWLARHGTDQLPDAHRDLTRQRAVLAERSMPALVEHLERVERGELGRDPRHTESPRSPRAPRASSPRAAAAPRPKKAVPPAGRRCNECFLVKAPEQFDGDADVCVDCR